MIGENRGPPYVVLLAVAVVVVLVAPTLIGEQGEAITGFIADLLSPLGLLLLPIILLLAIQFLSSNTGGAFISSIFSTGEPDSVHLASGSPVGVALFLILVFLLLNHRLSFFGGNDDSGE